MNMYLYFCAVFIKDFWYMYNAINMLFVGRSHLFYLVPLSLFIVFHSTVFDLFRYRFESMLTNSPWKSPRSVHMFYLTRKTLQFLHFFKNTIRLNISCKILTQIEDQKIFVCYFRKLSSAPIAFQMIWLSVLIYQISQKKNVYVTFTKTCRV